MGDTVSVQFKNGSQLSVVLFNHWDGIDFVKRAIDYVIDAKKNSDPLVRHNPNAVMVGFLQEFMRNRQHVPDGLYLGKNEKAGDNVDNGNFVVDVQTGMIDKTLLSPLSRTRLDQEGIKIGGGASA